MVIEEPAPKEEKKDVLEKEAPPKDWGVIGSETNANKAPAKKKPIEQKPEEKKPFEEKSDFEAPPKDWGVMGSKKPDVKEKPSTPVTDSKSVEETDKGEKKEVPSWLHKKEEKKESDSE